jgi:hypothetical protein
MPSREFELPAADVLLVMAQLAVAILALTIVTSVVSRLRDSPASELDEPQYRLTSMLCFMALILALVPFVIGELCLFWNELAFVQKRNWLLRPAKLALTVAEVSLVSSLIGHLAWSFVCDVLRGGWKKWSTHWSWWKATAMTAGHVIALFVQFWYFWALWRGRDVDERVGPYLFGVTWLLVAAGTNLMWFVGRSIGASPQISRPPSSAIAEPSQTPEPQECGTPLPKAHSTTGDLDGPVTPPRDETSDNDVAAS